MNALRTLAAKVANEPVVSIAGVVQSALVWLFTFVITGWDPSTHAQQLAGLATGAAVLISLIARQFVSPVSKVAAYIDPKPAVVVEPKSLADPAVAEDAA